MSFIDCTSQQLATVAAGQTENEILNAQDAMLNQQAEQDVIFKDSSSSGSSSSGEGDSSDEDEQVTAAPEVQEATAAPEAPEVQQATAVPAPAQETLKRKRSEGPEDEAKAEAKAKRLKEMKEKLARNKAENALTRKLIRELEHPVKSPEEKKALMKQTNMKRRLKKALLAPSMEGEVKEVFEKANVNVSFKEFVDSKGVSKKALLMDQQPVSPSMKSASSLKHVICALMMSLHGKSLKEAYDKVEQAGNADNAKASEFTSYKKLVKSLTGVNMIRLQEPATVIKNSARNLLNVLFELETFNHSSHYKTVKELFARAKSLREEEKGGKQLNDNERYFSTLNSDLIELYVAKHKAVLKEVKSFQLPKPVLKWLRTVYTSNFKRIKKARVKNTSA